MSTDKVDALIDNLSDELEPVQPMAHPFARMAPLIGVSLIYMIAVIAMIGPREDWVPAMFGNMMYFFEFSLSLSIFVSAALALGWLAIPDMAGRVWIKAVPVTLTGVFLVWAVMRMVFEADMEFNFQLSQCNLNGLFLIVLPVAVLTMSLRKGATTQPGWSAFMTILSFSGLGWAGLRFTCGADSFMHSFLIHFIPFVVLGIVFGLFAKRIFRW
ncbi:MAG: NrsF family protein [Pseudomonadota bacterium]